VPWEHERANGAAAIAWCAAQPWSTGAVATYGASYLANTQLLAATAEPTRRRRLDRRFDSARFVGPELDDDLTVAGSAAGQPDRKLRRLDPPS
jgi:X-Pro dipeptidyl-peptidase (S15 family)